MNQIEYIARQLSRAQKKAYEHYVVTRIWHLLDDTSIKFVTQQYVKRPEGMGLTDMYFPQLKVHVEIDEGHHFDKTGNRTIQDKIREADIITATGHTIKRVVIADKTLNEIHAQVQEIVQVLKQTKDAARDFRPWNFEAEQNPSTYIQRGYIDLKDDVAFRTMVDAANCFGNNYKQYGIWTGAAKHPEPGKFIWFPKLYENNEWNNSISDDDTEIREICKDTKKCNPHIDEAIRNKDVKRIVFARVISPLGDVMYRFKGEFELDLEKTNYENGTVLRRISERVLTYPQPAKF
jgi:very-short-patch-repair endonuclease